jgi:hypothetical protein
MCQFHYHCCCHCHCCCQHYSVQYQNALKSQLNRIQSHQHVGLSNNAQALQAIQGQQNYQAQAGLGKPGQGNQ